MNTIKVEFENFWRGFSPEDLVQRINRCLTNVELVYDGIQSDLVISGCFPVNPPPIAYKPRLLFVTENISAKHYQHLHQPRYTKKLGYIEDGADSCAMMEWFLDYDKLLNAAVDSSSRTNKVCHVMRNVTRRRKQLIRFYNSTPLSSDKRFAQPAERAQDKINMMKSFAYNLCPENSIKSSYITEKITEAILAGCVPIYEGGQLDYYTPLNLDRVIMAGNPLPKDPKKLLDLPVLVDGHQDIYKDRVKKIEDFILSIP